MEIKDIEITTVALVKAILVDLVYKEVWGDPGVNDHDIAWFFEQIGTLEYATSDETYNTVAGRIWEIKGPEG